MRDAKYKTRRRNGHWYSRIDTGKAKLSHVHAVKADLEEEI